MRARMALHYSGIAVEVREIMLKNKPAHMLQISPKATVPVLLLTTGEVIDESLNIMHWALAQHDPENWLMAGDLLEANATEQLIAENDKRFKQVLDRYKYAVRFPQYPPEFYRGEGERFLSELETRLKNHAHLCRETRSLADMAIFPFIRQFAAVDQVWFEQAAYPRLRLWLEGLLQSRIFLDVMGKCKV